MQTEKMTVVKDANMFQSWVWLLFFLKFQIFFFFVVVVFLRFVRSCTLEGFENLQQSNVMSNSCDSWQTLDIQPNIVPGPTDKGTNKVGHEGNGHISLTLEPGDKFHFDPSSKWLFLFFHFLDTHNWNFNLISYSKFLAEMERIFVIIQKIFVNE